MDDVFIYMVDLPSGINEVVTPCLDGYTIYINKNIADNKLDTAINHAMAHIQNSDFEKTDIQKIESYTHIMM